MENVLESLDKMSKIKRFLRPEQMLISKINELDEFLVSGLPQETLTKIEATLLSLFSVNQGKFSIQCALSIASKLLRVYELSKSIQFFDFFSLIISHTTTTTVVAAGYVIKYVGQRTKSQLPRLVEHLLKQPQNLDFAVVYALRYVFKTGSKTVEDYVARSFQFAKKAALLPRQTTITACMKLFKTLIRYCATNKPKNGQCITSNDVIEVIRQVMKDDMFPVVKNEIATLLAYCVFEPLQGKVNKENDAEWAIEQIKETESNIFDKAIEQILQFKPIINMTVLHFLDLITPEMISHGYEALFKFIRDHSMGNMPRLVPMLPEEVRILIFEQVAKEKSSPLQLQLLTMLCPSSGSIKEAAAAAINLACNVNKLFRRSAMDFFADFSKGKPSAANTFLGQSLKFLVDNQNVSYNNIRGYAYIAKTILNNLIASDVSISEHRATINQLITMLQTTDVKQDFFAGVFHILSVLPEEFGRREDVCSIVDNSIKQITGKSPEELRSLKALILFRAAFPDKESNKLLFTKALSLFDKLPMPVIQAICENAPVSLKDTAEAYEAAKKIIERTKSLKISTELIKKFLKNPLPTGLDLLKLPIPLTAQQIRDQAALEKIIKAFPDLYAAMTQKNQLSLFETLLETTAEPIVNLYLLSLFQSKYSSILPKTALNRITQQANTNNFTQSQLRSECVGAFLRANPASIGNVLSFIEQLPTISGCLLINALASYARFSSDDLLRAIIYVNSKIKEPKLMAFASSALYAICANFSMEILDNGLVANQFAIIFEALQTTTALQPVILCPLSKAFAVLIEIASIELANSKQLGDMVRLITDSIRLMPITYAREAFFAAAKSIFTFAFPLNECAPIRFPTSVGSTTTIQLSACDAFSVYAKFKAIDFDLKTIILTALSLLQRTGDDRAAAFVQALAVSSNDLVFWISHIRRILLVSSLFDTQTAPIEPTPEVKKCCLDVSQILLVKLANAETLNTEFLDDIISSACKAVETDLMQLQVSAFPLLQKVIDLFRNRKTEEGNSILDLYDAQFKQAVRVGFTLDLAVSGSFLYTYLSFSTQNMSQNVAMKSILDVYVTGLTACKQRASSYYSLATHLCTSARKDPAILEAIKDFLDTLAPEFAEIIKQAMQLYKNRKDWRAISKFREHASSFYQELLPAFVWLQSRGKTIIPIETLVSFFLLDLHLTREKWISAASFDAITVAIRYCGSEIQSGLIELILRSAVSFFPEVSSQQINEFLLSCGKAINMSTDTNKPLVYLLSLTLQYSFNIRTIAYLLKNDSELVLAPFLLQISKSLIEKIGSVITMQDACALYSLMFYHYPTSVASLIPDVLLLQNNDLEGVIDVISNAICAFQGSFPINIVSRFCIATFRRGGMLLIANALINRPEVGVALLSLGGAKSAIIMCLNDFANIKLYLRFIELCLDVCGKYENVKNPFTISVVKLCMKLIVQYGNDIMNGHQTVQQCVQLLQMSKDILGDKFINVIDEIDSFDRTDVMQMLETHIEKANLKKKSKNLAVFSSNARTRKTEDDEWQTLEISDE